MIYNVLNIIRVSKVRRTRGARHVVYITNSSNISDDIPPRKRPCRSKRKVGTKTGLVVKHSVLLEYYDATMGNRIPTVRGKAQDPSLLVQMSMETLEISTYQDEVITMSRNVAV